MIKIKLNDLIFYLVLILILYGVYWFFTSFLSVKNIYFVFYYGVFVGVIFYRIFTEIYEKDE